jgi:predicted AlkP superfamily phosphohydrolase/phosphomutase
LSHAPSQGLFPDATTGNRLFVFGWDCADWSVIAEGWRRGMLGTIRALAGVGESGTLVSTIPPVTAPAWTSFLTGVDPGEHGIFGFRSVDPSDHRPVTVPGGARRVSTLMKRADDAGYRTCTVTVPWTYPAETLQHGAVVPGWDAPDETLDSCYPDTLGTYLATTIDHVPRRSPPHTGIRRFLEGQNRNVLLRERISDLLISEVDPQIFMVVFPEPDQATHAFWTRNQIPDHLLRSYEEVDRATGRMIERHVKEGDRVLIVSDHGGQPLHTHVHVGKLLEDGGFLRSSGGRAIRGELAGGLKRRVWNRLSPELRNSILRLVPMSQRRALSRSARVSQIDWSATKAFPRDDEAAGVGVDINLGSCYRDGPVQDEDYEDVRGNVARYLSETLDPISGTKVFSEVLFKEDAYQGPALDSAPDLLLLPGEGFGTRRGLDAEGHLSRVAVGGHRRCGVFVSNWKVGLPGKLRIAELLPRALADSGFDVPLASETNAVSPEYSEREAAEIEARLKDLGYIE